MPESLQRNAAAARRQRQLLTLAVALTGGIFLRDLSMPLGIAVCALYGIVILFGLFVER